MSTGFSTQEIKRMLGLSPARLQAYVRAGLLCPQRGRDGELRFSFQDLLLLRTAEGLVTERLPPRRVRDALQRLRRRLPIEQSLTGIQLGAEGGHVVVRDGGTAWRADSGQGLLTFTDPSDQAGPSSQSRTITELHPPAPLPEGAVGADGAPAPRDIDEPQPTLEDLYQLGCSLEDGAPEAARAAYHRVLAVCPDHADAHVNLGRLMHESGDLSLAEEHYRAAIAVRPNDSTAFFNLGVLLEDCARPDAAVAMYEAALTADPTHADAHFNAARLHDMAGRYEAALRHLREYRNLTAE